jgi:hypothetical protein
VDVGVSMTMEWGITLPVTNSCEDIKLEQDGVLLNNVSTLTSTLDFSGWLENTVVT